MLVTTALLSGLAPMATGAAPPGPSPFASWPALVARVFGDLVNRAPTASESSAWASSLSTGSKSRGDLASSLRRSSENSINVDPTTRLYRAFLGRAPDAAGLRFWVGERRSGRRSLTGIADYFAGSSEFKAKYGALTNRQFVTRIYTDVMGRVADAGGVDYWTAKLDSKAMTRGRVMVGFSESGEYKQRQAENTDVAVSYIFLMGRAASTLEASDWVTRQKAGASQDVLLTELLNSAKYADHIIGTPVTVPGTPTGVTASGANAQASVSWTAPASNGGSPIIGYVVTPYIGAAAQTAVVFNSTATSQTITGLANGTAYTFKVAARNVKGTGAQSAASNAVTPAPASVPGAPTAVVAIAGNGQAIVSWTAPASNGGSAITGYVVTPYIGLGPQVGLTFNSTATSQTITGLANGTTFTFKVAAKNAKGTGAQSVASNAVIPLAPGMAPGAPTAVKAVAGNGKVLVSWTAPVSSGAGEINGYVLTPYIGAAAQAPIVLPALPEKLVTGLVNGTVYTFKVAATNALGTGAQSTPSNTVTPAAVAPGAPTAVVASGANAQASVSWTPPPSIPGDITGYVVTPYVGAVAQAAVTFNSSATSQSVTGLTNGTAYTFKVAAKNAIGSGVQSSASNGATPAVALSDVVQSAAFEGHTCAVLAGGTVKCWGYGEDGRLGNGATANSRVPVPVAGITTATAVTTGRKHSCAMLSGGTIKCWGYNQGGVLGDGSTSTYAPAPVPVTVAGISTATAIEAGEDHTCAVLADGTVKCWGFNLYGRLGDGTTTTPSVPVQVSGISTAVAVSAGNAHTCAALSGGSVKCWGAGEAGQLGTGTGTSSPVPVTVSGITTATTVSVGGTRSCAVLAAGTVKCWGQSYLGDGTNTQSLVPVSVSGITTATAVSVGSTSTCVRLAGGFVRCWGLNQRGQLGDGTDTTALVPIVVPGLSTVTSISVGWGYGCAVYADGGLRCWGEDYNGQLANGSRPSVAVPEQVSGITDAVAVSAGDAHTCALSSVSTVSCWGRGTSGQLGNGSTKDSATPVPVAGITSAIAVSASAAYTCALLSDGTIKCWGSNSSGTMGNGSPAGPYKFPTPVQVMGITTARSIATRAGSACAVLADGTVKCWGYLWFRSDGIAENPKAVMPSVTTATAMADDGGGAYCVRLSDGTARCWGFGADGELGDGTRHYLFTEPPVAVSGLTGAVALSGGSNHLCALLGSGVVKCWGDNNESQIGSGPPDDALSPVTVPGVATATALSAGALHSCVLLAGGTATCWGANGEGQAGKGTTSRWSTPSPVSGLGQATAVSAGAAHTCAVSSTGRVWCWGRAREGQLGNGEMDYSPIPSATVGL